MGDGQRIPSILSAGRPTASVLQAGSTVGESVSEGMCFRTVR